MISVEKVCLQQGAFELKNISFEVPLGSYAILMGETGSGKTTLLEVICGLRRIGSGKLIMDGSDITNLECSLRQIGYVPQDSALFPTMRVDQQIAFGLDVRRISPSEKKRRVQYLADLLEISELLHRYPGDLSGGERQRIALARALSFRPRLLCLDEPFSALDEETRARMSKLLQTVHQEENLTVVHVTHNTSEALEMGTIQFQLSDGQVHSRSVIPKPD